MFLNKCKASQGLGAHARVTSGALVDELLASLFAPLGKARNGGV